MGPAAGYLIYIAVLSAGYYYNVTFVRFGVIDLGTRLVGMSRGDVSMVMAGLAVSALVVAVVTGVVMDRRGWSTDLRPDGALLTRLDQSAVSGDVGRKDGRRLALAAQSASGHRRNA